MIMRRGGYNNQTAVMHNNPHHGHHQPQHHQQQQQQNLQNHRLGGANRMYHHQSQPQQMVPYGHVNSPRPLSFPSPALSSSNNTNSSVLQQTQQQQYSQHTPIPSVAGVTGQGQILGGSGGGSPGSNSNYTSHPQNHSSGPSPVAHVGGDMPPVETVVARLETACRLLHGIGGNNTRVNEIGVEIQILSEDLRRVGPLLETAYPDVLDRVMSSMRDASAQPSLPPSLRLAIFELVELRASKWLLPSDSSNYYRQRRNINDAGDGVSDGSGPGPHYTTRTGVASKPEISYTNTVNGPSPPSSGTSPVPPTNPADAAATANAKTYREEVVIKNSDSGKVAPTAKERVLSINGYSQQSISMAKQLIQETIQRNASPVFDGLITSSSNSDFNGIDGEGDPEAVVVNALKKLHPPSKSDDNSRFSYSVTLGEELIKISGKNLQFVQEAKLALDDYFSQKYPELFFSSNDVEDEVEIPEVPRYDRVTLLSLALVKTPAPDFAHLDPEVRGSIVLENPKKFDPEKFCKEMTGLMNKLHSTQSHQGIPG